MLLLLFRSLVWLPALECWLIVVEEVQIKLLLFCHGRQLDVQVCQPALELVDGALLWLLSTLRKSAGA